MNIIDASPVGWLTPVIAAAVFASGNTAAHAIRKDIHNFGDGLKYAGQGTIAGLALGAVWLFAPFLPYAGTGIQTVMTGYVIVQLGIGVSGSYLGLGSGLKIFLGNFYLNENNWLGGIGQGISRHTWEMLQTFCGHAYTQGRNIMGKIDKVNFLGGATFASRENPEGEDGISLGNYININIKDEISGSFDKHVLSDFLFMHEYGHTIDSRIFGVFYLFVIGLPSLISASRDGNHLAFWTEERANKHAEKYFVNL